LKISEGASKPLIFILGIVSILSLLPFYLMTIMGTYFTNDLFTKLVYLPGNYFLQNLRTILHSKFFLFYWNSFYVAALSTVLCVFVSALTGFAFAKYKFKGQKGLYYFILGTMMVPSQLGLVAFAVEMRNFHWVNTHLPLIIPWAANAFGVFWMTQYIKGAIPDEILESARIDGCNEIGIFSRIVMPFIKPAITTLSMLSFLWSWNNYLTPLIILNKVEVFTIPLGISTLDSYYMTDYGARILALSIGILPLLVIFIVGSKNFIKGITAGAVKG
jgi:cellobiose transport system permease protein